jgi:hypothetical protein
LQVDDETLEKLGIGRSDASWSPAPERTLEENGIRCWVQGRTKLCGYAMSHAYIRQDILEHYLEEKTKGATGELHSVKVIPKGS